jgi:hypothetical protein
MPYDPSKAGGDQPAADAGSTSASDRPNPFLQMVDPSAYRQLVKRALGNSGERRLVSPLSRVQRKAGGAAALARAWDEELDNDTV